jgi:OPA family sugar phosphate sensor protein UhpC-like MFS transporter
MDFGIVVAACYVTRYAFESWGVIFLTEAKGYNDEASAIISISQFAIAGIDVRFDMDKFFHHQRSVPACCWDFLRVVPATFVYVPAGNPWSDREHDVFQLYRRLGDLLGGLMAVDICSKSHRRQWVSSVCSVLVRVAGSGGRVLINAPKPSARTENHL